MNQKIDVFKNTIEVPKIVQRKANAAFEEIIRKNGSSLDTTSPDRNIVLDFNKKVSSQRGSCAAENDSMKNDAWTDRKESIQRKSHPGQDTSAQTDRRAMHDASAQTDRRTAKRYPHFFHTPAAAAGFVAVLAAAGITVAAAGFRLWSRGMQGAIQTTSEQQQSLIDQGVAITSGSGADTASDDYLPSLAVTDKGITITPTTVIADDRCVNISFSVKGYDLPEGEEPGFDYVYTYLDSEIGHMERSDAGLPMSSLNFSASFYDGLIPNFNVELGQATYEDGSPLQFNSEGDLITHYTDEEGNLEYVLTASPSTEESLLGQTLHVDLANIEIMEKAEFKDGSGGSWKFAIALPKVSSAKDITVNKPVPGSDFTLKDISISPISIRVNYTSSNTHDVHEDILGVPSFTGLILKDGTRYTYLSSGGTTAYTDDTRTNAYNTFGLAHVINPDDVASLLIYPSDASDSKYVEIPLD